MPMEEKTAGAGAGEVAKAPETAQAAAGRELPGNGWRRGGLGRTCGGRGAGRQGGLGEGGGSGGEGGRGEGRRVRRGGSDPQRPLWASSIAWPDPASARQHAKHSVRASRCLRVLWGRRRRRLSVDQVVVGDTYRGHRGRHRPRGLESLRTRDGNGRLARAGGENKLKEHG